MRGIAYHHSGLLPFLKEILEILFARGLVKVLFATETFAVGINMPTKTVVFTALEKYTDGGLRPLRSAEYIQMAGRAGRRGKDDKGLVLYLPQRDPLDLGEFHSVLMGKAGSFGSRLTFDYDFVLKLRNSGRPLRTQIEGSYWWRLAKLEYQTREKEFESKKMSLAAIEANLSESQREACKARCEIEERLRNSQNSRKKAATRDLAMWTEEHPPQIWAAVVERYQKWMSAAADVAASVLEPVGTEAEGTVGLRLRLLSECGYVGDDGELTPQGRLASEVNEGHPFLVTELFGRMRTAPSLPSVEELLVVLATFLAEQGRGTKDEVARSPDQVRMSEGARAALWALDADARRFMALEERLGVPSNPDYWSLSTEYIEPVADWLSTDEPLAVVAAKHGLFEGNFLKALMKLASLVEEFQSLATLAGEPRILALLESARPRLLRGVVVAESLYLRL
jgi:superfamily II RNA helicase